MADQILTLNGKQAAAGSGVINLIPPDFISGLKVIWNSATSLSVTTGAACRPSDSLLMMPAALITKSGLALTASTWYHLYLYMNGANPDVEIVTTAPAAPYFGAAMAKTSDTTRRYIGSVLTNSSGNLYQFVSNVIGNELEMKWVSQGNQAPWRLLSSGTASVPTNFSVAGLNPANVVSRFFFGLTVGFLASGSDASFGVGAAIDGTAASPELTAEVYGREDFNGTNFPIYKYLPAFSVTANGANLQYIVTLIAGTVNLSIDTRGVAFAR